MIVFAKSRLAHALEMAFGTRAWFSVMEAKKALGYKAVDKAKLDELYTAGLLDRVRSPYSGPMCYRVKAAHLP